MKDMNPYETAYQLACDKLARLDLDEVAFNSSARLEPVKKTDTKWLSAGTGSYPDESSRCPPEAGRGTISGLEDGKLYLDMAGQTFVIEDGGKKVTQPNNPTTEPKISEKILLLHYLITADGTRMSGQEVALRDIAGAAFYYPTYKARSIDVIQRSFGADRQRFLRAVKTLGWSVVETPSFIKVRCLVLPNVSITFIYRPASAEFSASMDILYDASITHYLPLEDIIS
ncbi:MAG: DUF3786 domain-containing protein [Planctomycetes bacterium]|nr:DUF3786 domain-containing protein [Planctomycetota bacterium]